jgi:hypothetical protein
MLRRLCAALRGAQRAGEAEPPARLIVTNSPSAPGTFGDPDFGFYEAPTIGELAPPAPGYPVLVIGGKAR